MVDVRMADATTAPSTSSEPVLAVQNLEAWYGESHILHGINFQVNPGEVVTLLGRNGAGKTTTLKSVMGIIGKRSGSIRFDGNDIKNNHTTTNKNTQTNNTKNPKKHKKNTKHKKHKNKQKPPTDHNSGLSM